MPQTIHSAEQLAVTRKRLRYRAWHRGMREMDLVLGGFADARLESFEQAELARFEILIEELDGDLLSWITGQYAIREDADHEMMAQIIAFQKERPKAHNVEATA
jgi:antitoxin CptB